MRTLMILGTLAVGAVLGAAPTASADRAPVTPGKCTSSSTSKIKAKLDDGRIESEFEVDQNANGRRWSVVLRRNGRVAFRGIRTTRGPSGSFELRRFLSNGPGRDRIVATARALRGGEVCTASTSV
jgi:osmotically-inducible protein OsmY